MLRSSQARLSLLCAAIPGCFVNYPDAGREGVYICASDQDCLDDFYCDADGLCAPAASKPPDGEQVECNNPGDCYQGYSCVDGSCVANTPAGETYEAAVVADAAVTVLRLQGATATVVRTIAARSDRHWMGTPAWSPDGTHLAISENASPVKRTVVYEGANLVDSFDGGEPDWAPNAKIAFVGDFELGIRTLGVSSATLKDGVSISPKLPKWDGTGMSRIGFIGSLAQEEYYISAERLNVIYEDVSTDFEVSTQAVTNYDWSPSENAIAYVQETSTENVCELRKATLAATSKDLDSVMLSEVDCNAKLAWSPDGTELALAADVGSLYILAASTQDKTLTGLTPTDQVFAIIDLDWTHDGAFVGYLATPTREATTEIRLVTTDGTTLHNAGPAESAYAIRFSPAAVQ